MAFLNKKEQSYKRYFFLRTKMNLSSTKSIQFNKVKTISRCPKHPKSKVKLRAQHAVIIYLLSSFEWNALSILINEKCYKNLSFDVCNVLFCVNPLNGENRILNFEILYTCAKQYIFSCLKQNKAPICFGLLHYLNQRYKIIKSIYIQNS